MNIMPLGDHLRADQKIDLSRMKLVQHSLKVVAIAHGIAIKASDARLRKRRMQSLFNFL